MLCVCNPFVHQSDKRNTLRKRCLERNEKKKKEKEKERQLSVFEDTYDKQLYRESLSFPLNPAKKIEFQIRCVRL